MIDFLFQTGLSNTCFALLITVLALVVGFRSKRPQLCHLLWLLVLVKLVTPPLYNVPIQLSRTSSVAPDLFAIESTATARASVFDNAAEIEAHVAEGVSLQPMAGMTGCEVWVVSKPWLLGVWFLGTFVIGIVTLFRAAKFNRLLRQHSRDSNARIQSIATELAANLGLIRTPEINTTTANLSPMVWWFGGKVQIILPQAMLDEMKEDQWKWALAHELAHVHRRDYLTRWLEWIACACFWWNPLVWLAQRNLRATEEICCDELVLSSFQTDAKTYAESIFKVVESLVRPVLRPPAMASEINSGGFLERRIQMILSSTKQTSSPALRFCVAALVTLMIPLGLVQAQDFDAIKKRLTKAVKNDEITFEQAAIMMNALEDASHEHHHDEEHEYHRDEGGSEHESKMYRLDQLEERLHHAIKEGEISEDEAEKKWHERREALGIQEEEHDHEHGDHEDREHEHNARAQQLEQLESELQAAREALSAKEARLERGLAISQDQFARLKQAEARLKQQDARMHELRIKESLGRGKVTVEEAKEKHEALRMEHEMRERHLEAESHEHGHENDNEHSHEQDEGHEDELKKLGMKIREAIAKGEISVKEGREKYEAIRKQYEKHEHHLDRESDEHSHENDGDHGSERDEEARNIGMKIRVAIAKGEISVEEGKEKYQALLKEYEKRDRRLNRESREHNHENADEDSRENDDDHASEHDKDGESKVAKVATKLREAVEAGVLGEDTKRLYRQVRSIRDLNTGDRERALRELNADSKREKLLLENLRSIFGEKKNK